MNHLQSPQTNIIVIKIGTESLFHGEGRTLGGEKIEKLCADIAHIIKKTSDHIVLVTSWAVGFGRQIIWKETLSHGMVSKQYLASVGQKALMTAYDNYFTKHHIVTGQVLVTHADIEDDEIRKDSVFNVITSHFDMRTLPIVNENDTISTEEMQALGRGADNDQNALLIARLIWAKTLYIITNTNGVYEDRDNANSRIEEIESARLTKCFIDRITWGKSEHGTGGMQSKLEVAREAAAHGIDTHIIDGTHSTLHDHYYGKNYGWTIIRV